MCINLQVKIVPKNTNYFCLVSKFQPKDECQNKCYQSTFLQKCNAAENLKSIERYLRLLMGLDDKIIIQIYIIMIPAIPVKDA